MSDWAHWKNRFVKINKSVGDLSKKAAVFVLAGTVIGYWNSFEDKIADRHERAWSVIRTAMEWSEKGSGGNVGQNNAIGILTRDCEGWATIPPFSYVLSYFFQDCVPLRSLSLKSMDFRSLRASGGDLSDGYFACSNFGDARLRNTRLHNAKFHAADLRNADLSGADLDNACFYDANLAGVNLSGVRNLDASALLNACILKVPGEQKRTEAISDNPEIQKIATQIPDCSGFIRCDKGDWSKRNCEN
jgi:Pentapeptide repeats (8 copies)